MFWKVRCDLLNKGKERDENQFSIYRSFQVGKRPAVEEWHYHWLPIQLLVVVSSDNIHNYHVEVINCKLSYTLSISAKFYLVFVEKSSEKKNYPSTWIVFLFNYKLLLYCDSFQRLDFQLYVNTTFHFLHSGTITLVAVERPIPLWVQRNTTNIRLIIN